MPLSASQLAQEGHGAIQVGLPDKKPLLIVLGGPIKYWWEEGQWDTDEHWKYVDHRDAVRVALVKMGFLVYSPHRAWQGAWGDMAQFVNDRAIEVADVFINLGNRIIPASGTEEEMQVAHKFNTLVLQCPFDAPDGEIDFLVGTLRTLAIRLDRAII